MQKPSSISLPAVLLAGCVWPFASCATAPTTPTQQLAVDLDAAANFLKEYGSVVISAPLLSAPEGKTSFEFGLSLTADNLYGEARKFQGAAATSDKLLQSLAIGVSAQIDPTQQGAFQDQLAAYERRQQATKEIDRAKTELAQAKLAEALKAAEAETDPVKKAAAITKARSDYVAELSANLSGPTTRPTADSTTVPAPADGGAQAAATAVHGAIGGQNFSAPGALLPTKDFTLRPRDAMITAAGDRAMQAILNLFGKPQDAAEFANRNMFFGAAIVSVLPGWRSRSGYAAELAVQVESIYEDASPETIQALAGNPMIAPAIRTLLARQLPQPWQDKLSAKTAPGEPAVVPLLAGTDAEIWTATGNRENLGDDGASIRTVAWLQKKINQDTSNRGFEQVVEAFKNEPQGNSTVTAVSPLTDVQNLQTQSSWRERKEFALSLALTYRAAGQAAQAGLMEQYVRQQEADVATVGPDVAVTTYGAGGGLFGYQIGPSLRGLTDPSNPKSKAGYVLQRQSFPVLLLLSTEKADSQPLVIIDKDARRIAVLQPRFRFISTSRWMPLTKPGFVRSRFPRKDEFESARLRFADLLTQAETAFTTAPHTGPKAVGLARTRELINLINGSIAEFPTPKPPTPALIKVPAVARTTPDAIELAASRDGAPVPRRVTLLLAGTNLSPHTAATVQVRQADPGAGTVRSNTVAATAIEGALQVDVDVPDATGPLVISAEVKGAPAGTRVLLAAIPVTLKTNRPATLTFAQETKDDPPGVHRTITVDGPVPDKVLEKAETLIMGGTKPPSTPDSVKPAISK